MPKSSFSTSVSLSSGVIIKFPSLGGELLLMNSVKTGNLLLACLRAVIEEGRVIVVSIIIG